MTIASTTRKAGPLLGTGSQTAWPFAFKVFAAGDVAVTIANSAGVETALVLNTDYSVALNSNQETSPGGTITYPISGSALPSGSVLTVSGDVDYDQPLDLPSGGNFSPLAIENQLDRATMQIQQLKEQVDRSAKLPVTSSVDADALVADLVRLADSADNIDTAVANIAAIQTVASDLNEPVSEINTVAVSIANVDAVGTNITSVTTVAGISANVTTVAGNATNINAVAGNATNINAVNANKTNIDTVASNNTNVNTVATNITAVNTAATNISAIIAAPSQAAAAAASAAAAAASAASGMYSSVQDKSANYTVVAGDAGDLLRVDSSGGARTITLPAISSQDDGFKVAIVKWTGDANTVTVQCSGSDLINGSTTYVLDAQYKSATFVADFETNTWFGAGTGSGGTNIVVDAFTGDGSTTAFTLSGEPGSKNNTLIILGGVGQLKSSYSLAGAVITFSAAPPNGVLFEVSWSVPIAIGTPSDGTVSAVKLADAAVTTSKLADTSVTSAKLASGAAAANIGYTPANKAGETFTGPVVATALSDAIGNARSIPQNAKTASYTLAATDNGQHISITTGGVTVPSGVFSVGQSVVIFNNSASAQTITQGASTTVYNAGDGTTGNRTLGARGLATVLCVASNVFAITGAGLS